ncbi:MAG: A/G-specific adenine glycosylase, partial [Elusimicrobia bacterium]|nr:A/G-specific adenine glycosylase [Elusimicrobiota bacterium]
MVAHQNLMFLHIYNQSRKELIHHMLTHQQITRFRKKIYEYYRRHGRDLPWRKTRNPYHIWISEIMLQQTQVDRVKDKYLQFISIFPGFKTLAQAPLQKILLVWQGMGYNRRALYLRQTAAKIMHEHGGRFPSDIHAIMNLPGIGKHTASSISAFAFNKPVVFIETNIRSVFIHEFFPKKHSVPDRMLMPLIAQTLDHKNPAQWYNALMDYGVYLKKTHA